MKAWWTAQELALQTLPGLPTTKRKVNEVAAQQGWAERTNATGEKLARPKAGRGGGVEYHYSVLPTPAVAALVARGEIITRAEVVVPQSEAWAAYDALPEAKKAIATFRLDILREVEALRRAGHSATGAVTHVVNLHKAKARNGEGDHHAFSAATVYNWQKAVRGLNRGDWLPALAPRTQGRAATADCDPNAWEFLKGDYTGNSPVAKPEDYASRAVPLDVFKAVVSDVIRRHNAKVGRRSRVCRGVLSFDQAYEASLATAPPRKATDAQLRMCLLAHEAVTADKLTGAVNLFGNRYWSEFLSEYRGQKVVVRFDPDRLHEEPAHVYSMASEYLGAAMLQDAAGFADATAAREHGRAKTAWLRSQKAMLELERRLSATDVAALLPDIDEDDDVAPPTPRVVRMIGGLAAAPAAAPVEAANTVMDRYAEALARQRPDHLRLIE